MEKKNERPGGSRGAISFRRKQRLEEHSAPTTKIEALRRLVELGWRIFPIAPRRKVPLTRWASGAAFDDPDFQKRFESLLVAKAKKLHNKGIALRSQSPLAHLDLFRASDDIAMIDRWLARWPMAGFAVACGQSRLFVLDIDRHGDVDGTEALRPLQQRFGKLPNSPMQRTGGGGLQLIFGMPTECSMGNSCGKLGAGLDTRGEGGMAIVPPSIHPSGKAYRWVTGREPWTIPLTRPPDWLIKLLQQPVEPPHPHSSLTLMIETSRTRYAEHALMAELQRLREAKQGERNNVLNRVSFVLAQLAASGLLAQDATLGLIAGTARTIGLPEQEIVSTMRSGWERGFARPRVVQS